MKHNSVLTRKRMGVIAVMLLLLFSSIQSVLASIPAQSKTPPKMITSPAGMIIAGEITGRINEKIGTGTVKTAWGITSGTTGWLWKNKIAIGLIGASIAPDIMGDIVYQLASTFGSVVGSIFLQAVHYNYPTLKDWILKNPVPADFASITNVLIRVLDALFILAVTITGAYMVLMSSSPGGRAQAKAMFLKLMVGLVIIAFSTYIFDLMLNLSGSLTSVFITLAENKAGGEDQMDTYLYTAITVGDKFTLGITALVVIVVGIMLAMRYVLVALFSVVFPLALFLYSFDLTKGFGNNLLRMTIMTIAIQIVEAVLLAIIVLSIMPWVNQHGNYGGVQFLWAGNAGTKDVIEPYSLVAIGGLFLMALVPIMMNNLLGFAGGIVAMVGLSGALGPLGPLLTAAGGLGAGMGPGALMGAGAQQTFAKRHWEEMNAMQGKPSGSYAWGMVDKNAITPLKDIYKYVRGRRGPSTPPLGDRTTP